MSNTLDLESTNNVTIKGLKVNTIPPTYPINATVVIVEVLDPSNAQVAGTTNISCPYVSGTGSSSYYQGAIPSTVTLVEGTVYTVRVKATSGTNIRMWNESITATKAA